MDVFTFKITAAISILILTLITGFLPLRFAIKNHRLLNFGDAFACGVFLSAALIHMLPDAQQGFEKILGPTAYPVAPLLCLVTFMLLFLFERALLLFGNCATCKCNLDNHKVSNFTNESEHAEFGKKNFLTPFLLVFVLTMHSFVEGAAIGINSSLAGASIIFLAVIAHKGSESFAFASNLYRHALSMKWLTRIILFFSLITPIGVFAASATEYLLKLHSGSILEAIFNAIAAGTFLYLSTDHLVEGKKTFSNLSEIVALIIGAGMMAAVAIWV